MSDQDQDDQPGNQPNNRLGRGQRSQGFGKRTGGPAPDPARQLFGQRSGARPPQPAPSPASPEPTQPAPASPPAPSGERQRIPSAPYPRDAQYAPRPKEEPKTPEKSAPKRSTVFTDVDESDELTKLHPNYKLMMRVGAVFLGLVIMFVGLVTDGAMQAEEVPVPFGVVSIPALLFALFVIIRVPAARYNARGYQISRDRLRVVRGILWRSDTIVPFGRVQHIDVDQGPVERALGIATMTLHTAGSHNASVTLPGLGHTLATDMREEIREHIKRESL